jgi:hypothetical protein
MTNRQQAHLAAIAAEPDVDDWSELEILHAAQRRAKDAALSDTERVERDLALCARLVLLEDPALDPVVVPIFERLECDLAMLRARDRALTSVPGKSDYRTPASRQDPVASQDRTRRGGRRSGAWR